MNRIIVKKEDSGVVIIAPHPNKYGDDGLPFSECKALQLYIEQGREWFVVDHTEIPSKKDLESRCQLYHDGNEIKVDLNWEKRLMPAHLIKRKHIKRLSKKMNDELGEENTNIKRLFECQLEKEVCLGWTERQWYQQAVMNLDERVSSGENDKPLIRQKLQEKLND